MTPQIFDRAQIARNLARRPAGRDDFVTRLIHDDLADRLSTLKRDFSRALAVGPALDLLPTLGASASGPFRYDHALSVPLGPEGALDIEGQDYQLIVSILDLQTVDDVPGYLSQLARRLAPDGLLMAVALGGESLTELRQAFFAADTEILGGAYARVAPFIAVREAGALLQRAGLALPVADIETLTVRYADSLSLMRELQALGASNPLADRPKTPASRRLILAVEAAYRQAASDEDGRLRATLELLWLSGWSPHDSQQKPLRPGSAKTRLADALGSKAE
jgi:SAM-dependent methyltransferase